MRRVACLLALLCAPLAFADDELTPEKAAKVAHDRDKAMEAVNKKYGNKKSSELSGDERREMMRDQVAATNEAYEKHGVTAKAFETYEARTNRDDRAAIKAATEKLVKQEADDAKKAAEKDKAPREIPIQKGFSDANPVTLEDQGAASGNVTVEKGLPADAQEDQNSANSGESAPAAAKSSKSATKTGGKSKHR